MGFQDILPPHGFVVVLHELIVKALLPQVFVQDLSSLYSFESFNRAVFAIGKTIIFLLVIVSIFSVPKLEVRSEQRVLAKLQVELFVPLQKVDRSIVRARVPKVPLHSVIRMSNIEDRYQRYIRVGVLAGFLFLQILEDDVPVLLADHHSRNPDPVSRAVVNHDNILNILLDSIVNHNSDTASCMLNIPNFLNERAVASINKDHRRRHSVRIARPVNTNRVLTAAVCVLIVVPDSADDRVAVLHEAKVGKAGLDLAGRRVYFVPHVSRVVHNQSC
eukprot:CAMPEP_0168350950 /NCGR_PEP_ID=MMETSP0213-20121227/21494_1 /TAXON_ID=151035 /ORGANISM="Euplotes harpa, Strain FSP1.4" /LENGTH=274 /DNA_ID=CAMNT_0008361535 /DNA_START=480 /DNA_END=1301 /DNA_ORIENTATION=-